MQRIVLTITLILFSALSVKALWQVGYLGLFSQQFANSGTQQVLTDLIIAVCICMYRMWHDANATGRNVWPWLALSMVAGSFGPLLYMLTAKRKAAV